jgi:diguanylate cyclase (GGDEF)-like protein
VAPRIGRGDPDNRVAFAPAMDPTTVVIILAIHLVCSGGLYHLIGRSMPPRSGLDQWSVGATLFGAAYLGRLASRTYSEPPWALVPDAAMVVAGLLFISGVRRFLGRTSIRGRRLAALLLGYALVHAWAVWNWGPVGRYVLLNATLGLLYATLAFETWRAQPREIAALQPPLVVLTTVMGALGVLTMLRGLHIATNGTPVMLQGLFAQLYYAYASLAALLLGLNLLWMVFVRLNTQLIELASRDALTRVLNRNGLDEVVARHFAAREPTPITLLQVDVDHFKQVNDSHGHAAGDRLLQAVAEALTAHVRASDFVARVGGEEFLVGCVAADAATAPSLAERLRQGVRDIELAWPGARTPLRCTVSIGIARPCPDRAGWERAWAEADRALYMAKATGRDRVVDTAGHLNAA